MWKFLERKRWTAHIWIPCYTSTCPLWVSQHHRSNTRHTTGSRRNARQHKALQQTYYSQSCPFHPENFRKHILSWSSNFVEEILLRSTRILQFLLTILVKVPAEVSIPRDNGVSSGNNFLPFSIKRLPFKAAPITTASSGSHGWNSFEDFFNNFLHQRNPSHTTNQDKFIYFLSTDPCIS